MATASPWGAGGADEVAGTVEGTAEPGNQTSGTGGWIAADGGVGLGAGERLRSPGSAARVGGASLLLRRCDGSEGGGSPTEAVIDRSRDGGGCGDAAGGGPGCAVGPLGVVVTGDCLVVVGVVVVDVVESAAVVVVLVGVLVDVDVVVPLASATSILPHMPWYVLPSSSTRP